MKEELAGVAWEALLTEAEGDPDVMYDIFCKKILDLQERHIPTRIINGPSKHKAYRLTPIEKKSIERNTEAGNGMWKQRTKIIMPSSQELEIRSRQSPKGLGRD